MLMCYINPNTPMIYNLVNKKLPIYVIRLLLIDNNYCTCFRTTSMRIEEFIYGKLLIYKME